jgi:hypothetical protein
MCKSGRRIRGLGNINNEIRKKNGPVGFYLVFSDAYDIEDIEDWEKRIEMPFRKFFSNNIFSADELYCTDDSMKCDPLTVILDRNRKTVYIENPGTTEEEIIHAIEKTTKK